MKKNNIYKRFGTKTKAFGSSQRENHDSAAFYNSNIYKNGAINTKIKYRENAVDPMIVNKVFCKDSQDLSDIPNDSIHIMVTSPPYNVGKDYDDNLTIEEYRTLLSNVFQETHRVLVPGGRMCINIANLGRKPYLPLHSFIIEDALNIGFLMRGEIIWDKAASASGSVAWGSWMKASNPVLRDVHEYILVFCKETFRLENVNNSKVSTITKEEFLDYTKSIWHFNTESAKRVNHPAPFPIELPYRLIQLYTYQNDLVLDPFVGSGSTCVAALKTKRRFIGYDINKDYCKIANERLKNEYQNNELVLMGDAS